MSRHKALLAAETESAREKIGKKGNGKTRFIETITIRDE